MLKKSYTEAEQDEILKALIKTASEAAVGVLREQHAIVRARVPGMLVPFNPSAEDIATAIGAGVASAILAVLLSQTDEVQAQLAKERGEPKA